MKRIEFICGYGYDESGKALDKPEARLQDCRSILGIRYGAFTELDGNGIWANVSEPVKVFVVFSDQDVMHARGIAQALARHLNQQCVAVSVSEVNFKLVRQL